MKSKTKHHPKSKRSHRPHRRHRKTPTQRLAPARWVEASYHHPQPIPQLVPIPALWSATQTAHYLGLPKHSGHLTVLAMFRKKTIPGYLVAPNLVRFDPAEIRAWLGLKRNSQKPNGPQGPHSLPAR